tara:strand:- start:64 stop:783 length:720 start_codon:yes stop_codon:yes gene_type:complete
MNQNSLHLKLILGTIYLIAISIGLYFLFSTINIEDLGSYEFIRENKDIILKYKSENFLFLSIIFFVFSIIWILFLGFVTPLAIFSGFVFGKWWGVLIVLTSISIGASLLYMLAGFFLRDVIEKKLAPKFSKLKEFFIKNDILYFMIFRFLGGIPFAIQNLLPILFDMPIKNYFIATFLGCMPVAFVIVALGSGIENVIDQNEQLNFSTVLFSPEIYIPIIVFFVILFVSFVVKKLYFKQ